MMNIKKGNVIPGAHCPNHGCSLLSVGTPGVGSCEISDALFNYRVVGTEIEIEKKDEYIKKNIIQNGRVVQTMIKVQPPKKVVKGVKYEGY